MRNRTKQYVCVALLIMFAFLATVGFVKYIVKKRKHWTFHRNVSARTGSIRLDKTTDSISKVDTEVNQENSDKDGLKGSSKRIKGSTFNTTKPEIKAKVYESPYSKYQAESILRKTIYMHHMKHFVKPPNETCKKRLPACIVVGVAKCGTRELMDFMRLHPHIEIFYGKRTYEMPYFARSYKKGQAWFQRQMPCSYSNQITIMKNAWYFHASYIPERIKKVNESIKLIVLVREPVARAISQFTFLPSNHKGGTFDAVAIKGNKVNAKIPSLVRSVYDKPMKNWLKYFNLDQFLIIDSDELKYDPAAVLTKVEDFLGLGHYITPEMFVLDEDKGFYCIQSKLTKNGKACYAKNRGRSVQEVSASTTTKLRSYFKPNNERFFKIIGKSFNW